MLRRLGERHLLHVQKEEQLTCCRHESAENLDGVLSLALLGLAQNLDALLAGLFRQPFNLRVVCRLSGRRRVYGLNEDLRSLQRLLLCDVVCRLEYLRLGEQAPTTRMYTTPTSSLSVFHSLRANSLAIAGPYTGRHASRVSRVSFCDKAPVRYAHAS